MAKNAIVQSTPTPVGHPTSFPGKGKGGNVPTVPATQATPNAANSFNRERAQQIKHSKPVPMSQ
jgi:hypothetical protein